LFQENHINYRFSFDTIPILMGGLCPKRLSYLVENIAVLIRLVPVRSKSEGTTVFSCQLSLYHRMIGIHISSSEFGFAFLFWLLILQDVVYHPTRNPNYQAKPFGIIFREPVQLCLKLFVFSYIFIPANAVFSKVLRSKIHNIEVIHG